MKWIFFDLDDTLWNFSANSAESLKKLYEISPILRKLFPSREEFIDIYHHHNYQLWQMYSRGEVTTSQLKHERWRRTLATRQFEVLTAVCEELERNYLDILARGTEKMEGAEEMLKEITKFSLVGILSNGFTRTQYAKLENSGLWRYVTRVIVSEEIGINKPDKRLFDFAIQETGATQPVLMVGDNFEADVLGAMKAGWKAIWFTSSDNKLPLTREEMIEQNIDPDLFLGVAGDMNELSHLLQP